MDENHMTTNQYQLSKVHWSPSVPVSVGMPDTHGVVDENNRNKYQCYCAASQWAGSWSVSISADLSYLALTLYLGRVAGV